VVRFESVGDDLFHVLMACGKPSKYQFVTLASSRHIKICEIIDIFVVSKFGTNT